MNAEGLPAVNVECKDVFSTAAKCVFTNVKFAWRADGVL